MEEGLYLIPNPTWHVWVPSVVPGYVSSCPPMADVLGVESHFHFLPEVFLVLLRTRSDPAGIPWRSEASGSSIHHTDLSPLRELQPSSFPCIFIIFCAGPGTIC